MTRESSRHLEFTGERFTPECVREIWYEHVHRYVLAGELVPGKTVLDAACGEGYGAHYLAAKAATVAAVDISGEAIEHASRRYQAPNLHFQVADCRQLPFPENYFDCVVSFETLEHLEEQEQLLREFRRVLKHNGVLLISSPDKAIYSGQLLNENPFHVRELYRHELENLLRSEFPATNLLGHKLAFHSMIWQLGELSAGATGSGPNLPGAVLHREQDGVTSRLPGPAGDAVYYIALCAAEEQFLPQLDAQLWLFDDAAESVYRHYHHEVRKNMRAGEILAARDKEIEALKQALRKAENPAPNHWWRRLFGRA